MLEKLIGLITRKKVIQAKKLLYIDLVIEDGKSVFPGEGHEKFQLKGKDMINVMQLKRKDAIRKSKSQAKIDSLFKKSFSNYNYIMLERACTQYFEITAPLRHYIVPSRIYRKGQVLESLPKEAIELEVYLASVK